MTEATGDHTHETAMPGSSGKPNKLLPWVVLLMAALALLYFLNRGCAGQSAKADETGRMADKEVDITSANSGEVVAKLAAAMHSDSINPNKVFVLDQVAFNGRSAVLVPESEAQLNALGALLKKHPTVNIRIEAHTDNDGTVKDNLDLSVKQAIAVKNHLQQNGISAIRIAIAGRGQYKPLTANNTPEGRKKNNRIELYLSGHQ